MKNTSPIISVTPALTEAEAAEDTGPEVELRTLSFSSEHHGARLDRALADLVPEFSRNYLQQLIELGSVSVNGRVIGKASFKVKASDSGQIELRPTPQSQAFKAESFPLDLVYQDEHLLVVNKPAGMVVHPAPGNWSGTLMNGLLGFDAQAFNLPRAGIVHRLDKDTSGLMVVARSRAVMEALVQAIAARTVKRQYLALAHGTWYGAPQRHVDAPVGRDPGNRLRMAVVDLNQHSGKLAQTDLECLANGPLGCLVKCTLHTGRTHQIRVHMASIGHPLVADLVYGGALAAGMQRQALHAARLALVHPVTSQPMIFEAKPPVDFAAALECWGLKYNWASF
ncbi:RluA family pseudouridine synthase [Rhodoferax sp.]|uniref:RluA family pseudouridine synthase n=1 Tax=Rhodoferax sp. TaxID=50421 RepID=UPI00262BAEAF|nr:RluA family pseudouridine synthase [Rhodoferax sp.]MDD2923708.1 RluA family pseudouridine synthase [Rhodoferax sp.]